MHPFRVLCICPGVLCFICSYVHNKFLLCIPHNFKIRRLDVFLFSAIQIEKNGVEKGCIGNEWVNCFSLVWKIHQPYSVCHLLMQFMMQGYSIIFNRFAQQLHTLTGLCSIPNLDQTRWVKFCRNRWIRRMTLKEDSTNCRLKFKRIDKNEKCYY